MRVLGIDLGSRSVKMVLMQDNNIAQTQIFDTAAFYRECCSSVDGKIHIDIERLGFSNIDKVVGTGYGRNNVNIAGAEIVIELKAHTIGAAWQTGLTDFTLLDMGGQDSKIISVAKGKMADMYLNDKCAASCGRYIENMANVLGIPLSELEKHYENPVELSSTCAVFGESELIGRISEGNRVSELAAGVNYSLFKRIKPLIDKFPSDVLVVTGGVARNRALIHFIEHETGFRRIVVPDHPQFNGAIGCCVIGMKN
ncbi:MAG: acyl-CoA dehydratase activase [Bacillota bacterium]|nr:acyl-CoA dehydratase activase [Bacillota bacterium]